jgi:hypothetical protein
VADATENPKPFARVCRKCGAETWVSRWTGRMYTHTAPDSTKVCRASNTVVIGVKQKRRKRIFLSPSPASVRTVSGGLPGHGKRR